MSGADLTIDRNSILLDLFTEYMCSFLELLYDKDLPKPMIENFRENLQSLYNSYDKHKDGFRSYVYTVDEANYLNERRKFYDELKIWLEEVNGAMCNRKVSIENFVVIDELKPEDKNWPNAYGKFVWLG